MLKKCISFNRLVPKKASAFEVSQKFHLWKCTGDGDHQEKQYYQVFQIRTTNSHTDSRPRSSLEFRDNFKDCVSNKFSIFSVLAGRLRVGHVVALWSQCLKRFSCSHTAWPNRIRPSVMFSAYKSRIKQFIFLRIELTCSWVNCRAIFLCMPQ